jgi:hypothetical protein
MQEKEEKVSSGQLSVGREEKEEAASSSPNNQSLFFPLRFLANFATLR